MKYENIAPISGIYQIVDRKHRLYIGSTINLKRRCREHSYKLISNCHENLKLQNYFNKYGVKSLYFEIILYCSEDSLTKLEQIYLDNIDPHFNISKYVGSTLGYIHTEDSKKLMSKIKKNLYKNQNQWNKGRNKPKEEKDKISKSLKEYYKNNPHPREGVFHTESTKRLISKKLEERKGKHYHSSKGILFQLSVDDNSIINTFISTGEAAKKAKINSNGNHKTKRTKILEATKIEGRTAYGYKWEWRKPRPNKTG